MFNVEIKIKNNGEVRIIYRTARSVCAAIMDASIQLGVPPRYMRGKIRSSKMIYNETQKIAALERQLEDQKNEMRELIESLMDYFPYARGIHDIFRGIEAMEEMALKGKK